jgi:hypothetical protein
VLRAGVGSAILAICDYKIFPANDALPGFGGPLRALFAIALELFFLRCQIIFVGADLPVFLEMFRRTGLGALPVIKPFPADRTWSNDRASALALLRKNLC